jgi:hypothetical protein
MFWNFELARKLLSGGIEIVSINTPNPRVKELTRTLNPPLSVASRVEKDSPSPDGTLPALRGLAKLADLRWSFVHPLKKPPFQLSDGFGGLLEKW